MTPPAAAADAVVVDSAAPVAAVRAPAASNAESRTATARLMVVPPFVVHCHGNCQGHASGIDEGGRGGPDLSMEKALSVCVRDRKGAAAD
ncbi:hypothetical protein GCM10010267_24960 [Streptomyces griseorubens]|nr:hypothetical protein GCM10010267_24960 [Streptomyces griseorubens]